MERNAGKWCALAAATLVAAGACREPQSPPRGPVAALLSQTYPLSVSVATTGFNIDPDGYVVWVDNSLSQAVGANGVSPSTCRRARTR